MAGKKSNIYKACAEERLWQMELQRRLGQGTLSEIIGI